MNARELVALGLPQECVAAAYVALKASGLIAHPTEVAKHISRFPSATHRD